MAAVYKDFLAAPSSSFLAEKTTLNYVTTAKSFTGPTDIIKQLNTLQKQVKVKKQEVLNLVEAQNAAVFEIETALEFQTSGGVYLPGLDDNFLTDRTAYLVITHIVTLDGNGKILQIRQHWDQGALLLQLDIIGRTGRNWPIKDSRDQLTMIQTCIKSSGAAAASTASREKSDLAVRSRGGSNNAVRGPHSSIQLFGSREELESTEPSSVVSPYSGNRPTQRSFADILGDEPEDDGPRSRSESAASSARSPYAGHRPQQRSFADILGDEPLEGAAVDLAHERSMSPSKAGQGTNFQPMRLFEGQEHVEDEDTPKGKSGSRFIQPNPKKYQHFEIGDGSDRQNAPQSRTTSDDVPKSKHDSQWSFNDFNTPHKPKPSMSYQSRDVRHWDTENKAADDDDVQPVGRARRDAETHFELQDDGERVVHADRPSAKARGTAQNDNLGLYKNNLFNQENSSPGPKRALGNITNIKDRGKDFDAHWVMTDEQPSEDEPQQPQKMPENRRKAVKMMEGNWKAYDESPKSQKENQSRLGETQQDTRIHIAGDGMGGKKGANRNWVYGAEGDADMAHKPTTTRKGGNQTSSLHDLGA